MNSYKQADVPTVGHLIFFVFDGFVQGSQFFFYPSVTVFSRREVAAPTLLSVQIFSLLFCCLEAEIQETRRLQNNRLPLLWRLKSNLKNQDHKKKKKRSYRFASSFYH